MFGSELDSEHPFDTIRAVARTRVRRKGIAILAGVGIVAGVWAGPVASAIARSPRPAPVSSRSYVVRGGDTLWSIAKRLVPDGDPRPVVDAIARANELDPVALVPGQTLLIPTHA